MSSQQKKSKLKNNVFLEKLEDLQSMNDEDNKYSKTPNNNINKKGEIFSISLFNNDIECNINKGNINNDNKDLFETFILFKKFLEFTNIQGNKLNQENIVNFNKILKEYTLKQPSIIKENKKFNLENINDFGLPQNENEIINNCPRKKYYKNYDDIPIKCNNGNFIDLVEKTLANTKDEKVIEGDDNIIIRHDNKIIVQRTKNNSIKLRKNVPGNLLPNKKSKELNKVLDSKENKDIIISNEVKNQMNCEAKNNNDFNKNSLNNKYIKKENDKILGIEKKNHIYSNDNIFIDKNNKAKEKLFPCYSIGKSSSSKVIPFKNLIDIKGRNLGASNNDDKISQIKYRTYFGEDRKNNNINDLYNISDDYDQFFFKKNDNENIKIRDKEIDNVNILNKYDNNKSIEKCHNGKKTDDKEIEIVQINSIQKTQQKEANNNTENKKTNDNDDFTSYLATNINEKESFLIESNQLVIENNLLNEKKKYEKLNLNLQRLIFENEKLKMKLSTEIKNLENKKKQFELWKNNEIINIRKEQEKINKMKKEISEINKNNEDLALYYRNESNFSKQFMRNSTKLNHNKLKLFTNMIIDYDLDDDKKLEDFDFNIPKKYNLEKSNCELINKEIDSSGNEVKYFKDNHKEIICPSGEKKIIFQDNFQIEYFINGDIKLIYPEKNKIVFLNKKKGDVETKYLNGLKILKLQNGTIEKYFPDKRKKIYYTDGTIKYIDIDGTEEILKNNNNVSSDNKGKIYK